MDLAYPQIAPNKYTSSQILHIYGISVVICGGSPTRQAASKSPQTTTETS